MNEYPFMYHIEQQPAAYNPYNNYGGYPYGYPPQQFQSYQPQQQYQPFLPGINTPLEVEYKDGRKVTIPASGGYVQGGSTVNQGGFNPLTGTITQPTATQGFNPYMSYMSNPNNYQQRQQGFSPYYPGQSVYSPFMGQQNYPYYYCGRGQNQFNYQLQEFLYNEQPSYIDTREFLAQIVLSDEEREKISHKNSSPYGVDYYGNPIYGNSFNSYQASQERQRQFEEARLAYQKHFTMLSRIAHAYSGEKIDEESAMKFFDPCPQYNKVPQNNMRVFNAFNSTEEERKQYASIARVEEVNNLFLKFQRNEYYTSMLNQQRANAFAQIKATHDKLIGVEPGQHYDLKTYMDNGYKLGVNIAVQKAKELSRNGTNKYSRNGYRSNISEINKIPVPISSKDDDYISIESMLKGMYDRNKRVDSILKGESGQSTFTSEPVFPTEYDAHKYFLDMMQSKKIKDDAMKAVR